MAEYEKRIIHQYAAALYGRAHRILLFHIFFFSGAGGLLGSLLPSPAPHWSAQWMPLGLAIFAGLLGYIIGSGKAYVLKLEAQIKLCQTEIETHTNNNPAMVSSERLVAASSIQQPLQLKPILQLSALGGIAITGVAMIIIVQQHPNIARSFEAYLPSLPQISQFEHLWRSNDVATKKPPAPLAMVPPAPVEQAPLSSTTPSTQEAPFDQRSVVVTIQNMHSSQASLFFFGKHNRARRWPGSNRSYILAAGDFQQYRLACEPGEEICYSAWVSGNLLNPYWGAGPHAREACQLCCFSCSGGRAAPIALHTHEATTPTPYMVWRVRSDYRYTVSLAFFSQDRRGHYWPGNDQAWILNDSRVHEYHISCRTGERICYGAWPKGNPRKSYWGVGFGGQQRCSRCCQLCDGRVTGIIGLR